MWIFLNIEILQNNQKFFENCIDLIPARIYLNADDRKQWFRLLNRDIDDDADDEDEDALLDGGRAQQWMDDGGNESGSRLQASPYRKTCILHICSTAAR